MASASDLEFKSRNDIDDFVRAVRGDSKGESSREDEEGTSTPLFNKTSDEKDTESPGSSSVLDKLQDVVESELYGKSRAIMKRNVDSMVCTSSVKLKGKYEEPEN